MSGKTVLDPAGLEERLRALKLRLAPEDLVPLGEMIVMLEEAAEVVRAPLPVSAEPANVLVLASFGPPDSIEPS